jgi:putative acetyltransferase
LQTPSLGLRFNLLLTDLGFIAYWAITAAGVLPAAWLFKDYDNPILIAWNWSFAPLDLLASASGLAALVYARRGASAWRALALLSLALTFCAGLLALSFWTLRGDFDVAWWLPNIYLVLWPLFFLPGLILPGNTAVPQLRIRDFQIGDEMRLHEVFRTAVHRVASADYTPQQIDAWAPDSIDVAAWTARMRALRPYVVEAGGTIVAYADLQGDGYIDHFFVSGLHPRQGIGTALMRHIVETATARGIDTLTADVSRTAQPLFERFGFVVVEQRTRTVRGVAVPNALMRKDVRSPRRVS